MIKNVSINLKFLEKKMRDTTAGACLIFIAEIVNFFFLNWDSLHARLNSHYEAWSYKKKKHKKDCRIQEICLENIYS